jgi:hypothetical protein
MLPIFPHTNAAAWIETWDKIEALEPELIIPGHGVANRSCYHYQIY